MEPTLEGCNPRPSLALFLCKLITGKHQGVSPEGKLPEKDARPVRRKARMEGRSRLRTGHAENEQSIQVAGKHALLKGKDEVVLKGLRDKPRWGGKVSALSRVRIPCKRA